MLYGNKGEEIPRGGGNSTVKMTRCVCPESHNKQLLKQNDLTLKGSKSACALTDQIDGIHYLRYFANVHTGSKLLYKSMVSGWVRKRA